MSAFQIVRDFGELGEGGLEVFHDLSRDHIGVGEIGAVFEAIVLQPKNVEVKFIALAIPRKIDAMGSKFTADSPWKSH